MVIMGDTERLYQTILDKFIQSTKRPYIIGIDGRCGSGKTYLSEILSKKLGDCTVFHVDDYFLCLEQRTPQRLAEPGGNVDRERMIAEIIKPLSRGENITYRKFCCKNMTLTEPIEVELTDIIVIEGAYAFHPEMVDIYDFKILADVDYDTQVRHIVARGGIEELEVFRSKWMPLEEKYFEFYGSDFAPDCTYCAK